MSRFSRLLAVVAITLCLALGLCACSPTQTLSFISVRMKGEDGAVVAIAQNEFTLGGAEIPVELTLYCSDEYTTNVEQMTAVDATTTDDLTFGGRLTLTYALTNEAYFCATVRYVVQGESRLVQSETILYDAFGNKKPR